MEVRRQERRGVVSRSRDASNKENICPLEASLVAAEMMGSRRSPLPAGFPRSPLQDITHILCPPNAWSDGEDSLEGQAYKKFKKEDSVGVCAQVDSESDFVSWKGMKSCMQFRLQAEEIQAEETTVDKVDVEWNAPVQLESCTEASLIDRAFSVHRDERVSSASYVPNCEGSAVKSESEVKCIEKARMAAQARPHEHANNENVNLVEQGVQNYGETAETCYEKGPTSAQVQFIDQRDNSRAQERVLAQDQSFTHSGNGKAGAVKNVQESDKNKCLGKRVVIEVNSKRVSKQDAQVKKRSTLSMLR